MAGQFSVSAGCGLSAAFISAAEGALKDVEEGVQHWCVVVGGDS
jgi:hypothetical protein